MEKKKKKINARIKGHSYERRIMNELNELKVFNNTIYTSRFASKMLDDAKVDLYGTDGYNLQLKAVETMTMNKMIEIIGEMPNDSNKNIVMRKINNKPEVVVMLKNDFYDMLVEIKRLNDTIVVLNKGVA